MKKIFFVFLLLIANPINAAVLILDPDQKYSQENKKSLEEFLSSIEKKIPPKMLQALSKKNKDRNIVVGFEKILDSSLMKPKCDNQINDFNKAEAIKENYNKLYRNLNSQVGLRPGENISFAQSGKDIEANGNEVYSYVNKENQIVLHRDFLNVILNNDLDVSDFNCTHRSLLKIAQGAVISSIALLTDFRGLIDLNSSTRPSTLDQSEIIYKNRRTFLKVFRYSYGEYPFISGWSKTASGLKLNQAFWPRSLSMYEFAGNPSLHFALNFEFFLMDPEYACRKPLHHDFFLKLFEIEDPFKNRNCEVNYELKIPLKNLISMEPEVFRNNPLAGIESYDLSPERIYNIYYLRAEASGNSMSSFGHSMLRIVACRKNEARNPECEKRREYDLIINPRANALEMQLNPITGVFGGYPSQFFITPFDEILEEYAQVETRNLYNVPFVGEELRDSKGNPYFDENKKPISVMPEYERKRFIWATLDQYWTYYGNYKFLSNNCSDESLRLYQMATTHKEARDINILKPQEFNDKLSDLGLVDQSATTHLEDRPSVTRKVLSVIPLFGKLFRKDMKWVDYEKRYLENKKSRVDNYKTMLSWQYDIFRSIREISIMEGVNPKKLDTLGKIEEQGKTIFSLAVPRKAWTEFKNEDFEKYLNVSESEEALLKSGVWNLRRQFQRLYLKMKTDEERLKFAQKFTLILMYIELKREKEMGQEGIELAYALAYERHKKISESKIPLASRNKIKEAVEKYSENQRALMPFRELSVQAGYGIPLKEEVVRGEEYVRLLLKEDEIYGEIEEALEPFMGPDKIIAEELKLFSNDLDRIIFNRDFELPKTWANSSL